MIFKMNSWCSSVTNLFLTQQRSLSFQVTVYWTGTQSSLVPLAHMHFLEFSSIRVQLRRNWMGFWGGFSFLACLLLKVEFVRPFFFFFFSSLFFISFWQENKPQNPNRTRSLSIICSLDNISVFSKCFTLNQIKVKECNVINSSLSIPSICRVVCNTPINYLIALQIRSTYIQWNPLV